MRAAIACLAFLLFPVAPALADKTLTVGTAGDYRPLTWRDPETGTYQGTAVDLVRAFGEAEGYAVEFVPTTWPTLMEDLLAGKFQMAAGGISYTAERAKQALVSDTVGVTGKTPLVRCGEEAAYATLAEIDRPETRVVTNRGGTNEQFALSRIDHAVVIIVPDNHLPFDYLKDGQADVMFTDSIEATYIEEQGDGLCAVDPSHLYTHIDKVYLFRRDEVALRDRFNAWFEMQDGR